MPPPRGHRRWSAIVRAAPTLLALALLAWAGRWFAMRWHEVAGQASGLEVDALWLAVAAVLLMLHAGSALAMWRFALQLSDVRMPWRDAVDVFAPSLLARYVPGRVWANAARLALSRRVGVGVRQAGGAMLWEAILALGTACAVATLTLHGSVEPSLWWTATVATVACVVALAVGLRWRGSPRGVRTATAVALLGWMLFAGAHLALARSVAPVGLDDFPLVAGAMALAWSAGYLAIVVPLGIGVRDGILLVLLAGLLEPAAALLFVALARLVQLGVDLTLTAAWLAFRRRAAPAA